MQKVTIPQEALEMAYTVREHFPGMTDPEIALELLRRGIEAERRETEQARTRAVEMLLKLSPDALQYILKPIEWAYNWTDQNEPESMTNEDSTRFSLVRCALHDNSDHVARLYKWHLAILHNELEKARKAREGANKHE